MERTDVEKLAELARIAISPKEADELLVSFNSILDFVSHVGEVSLKEGAIPEVGDHHNVMRDDNNPHLGGLYTEEILTSAPSREGDYIKVKKIL